MSETRRDFLKTSAVAGGALAVAIAVTSATLGYYLSFAYQLPTGPTMAALCALAWIPAALLRNR